MPIDTPDELNTVDTDIFDDLVEDSPTGSTLDLNVDIQDAPTKQLGDFVKELLQADADLENLEEQAKAMRAKRQHLALTVIPEKMGELGFDSMTVDGMVIELKQVISASIPVPKRQEAFTWLRDHGFGDLIKNIVSVNFGMGDDAAMEQTCRTLAAAGLDADVKTSVAPPTLKAFVAEQVRKGAPIPLETFGAFIAQMAFVKRSDKK